MFVCVCVRVQICVPLHSLIFPSLGTVYRLTDRQTGSGHASACREPNLSSEISFPRRSYKYSQVLHTMQLQISSGAARRSHKLIQVLPAAAANVANVLRYSPPQIFQVLT